MKFRTERQEPIGSVKNNNEKAGILKTPAFSFKIEIIDKKLFFNIVFVFPVLLPEIPYFTALAALHLHYRKNPNLRYDDETYKRNLF